MPTRTRTPIQLRLTLTTLAVLLLGMGLAAGLTWLAVEQLYLQTQQENLLAQAQLTAAALPDPSGLVFSPELYSQTSNVQPGIHTRLLGEQGAVLIQLPIPPDDTLLQMPQAENSTAVSPAELRQRPEIQSALQGTPATAIRRVASAGNRRVLYASAPVFAPDGSLQGLVYLATPLPAARLPVNLIVQLLGALLFAIRLAGLVGALLSRRIARPLEELAQAASAVAGGDLNQQVPGDPQIREFDSLGAAFNHMTANLRQAEQVKNAFIADVTHELRTPLTVINGTLETLEDGALDDLEGRGPLLKSMQAETTRLIRLVNDLLVLTRADAGALNLQLESIDLADLARTRCTHLAPLAAPRQVRFEITAAGPAEVWGDADRLTQVLDNLLQNAIRHTAAGSTITIRLQPEAGAVRCALRDQGPGIPADQLPLIFERFYRVEPARDRQRGGSGLGLAIVRALLAAQGGRVEAQSTVGQGTTLIFWLPMPPFSE